MVKITYPEFEFKIKTENGREMIFDRLRKTWLKLTPEEWVRQNFLQYLTLSKKYPSTLIAVEKEIQLGDLKKRFDILVYDSRHQPWMIIECKAMEIALDESVLHQVLRYNLSIPVPFLVITNGKFMLPFARTNSGLEVLDDLPNMKEEG